MAKSNGKKYRKASWYWGNYMTKVSANVYRSVGRDSQINDSEMEEYKNGQLEPYRRGNRV